MSEQTKAADDTAVTEGLKILRYQAHVRSLVSDCAAANGGARSACSQCRGADHCVVCKNRMPEEFRCGTARGCVVCDKWDGSFHACPS